MLERLARCGTAPSSDPDALVLHRVTGAPRYVRVGAPDGRGGHRLEAVIYGTECEPRDGDFNRFEDELMRDLGWPDADAQARDALALRWLRESRFAFEEAAGPQLVDGPLASSLQLPEPAAFLREGRWHLAY